MEFYIWKIICRRSRWEFYRKKNMDRNRLHCDKRRCHDIQRGMDSNYQRYSADSE